MFMLILTKLTCSVFKKLRTPSFSYHLICRNCWLTANPPIPPVLHVSTHLEKQQKSLNRSYKNVLETLSWGAELIRVYIVDSIMS